MSKALISVVAGMTRQGVIGRGNALPWKRHTEDMASFKNITKGQTVIMGRRTFDSIGHPLPNRNNIVMSKTLTHITGCAVCPSLHDALELAATYGQDICVIGGASIYKQALPLADTLYLSFIAGKYPGDTFFPEFDDHLFEVTDQIIGKDSTLTTLKRKHT